MTDHHDNPDLDAADIAEPLGIACPRCGCAHLLADDNRSGWFIRKTEPRRGFIRRRRVCRNCGRVVYTREEIEDT